MPPPQTALQFALREVFRHVDVLSDVQNLKKKANVNVNDFCLIAIDQSTAFGEN
jgi:hypothetical protein